MENKNVEKVEVVNKEIGIFSSHKFNSESLQDVLWDTLEHVRGNAIETESANAIVAAAKTICIIAKLELQQRALSSMIRTTVKEVATSTNKNLVK